VRVVVADDDLLVRAGITRLLETAGHDVVAEVGSAPAVERAVATTAPDLVVVDIRMPPSHTTEGLDVTRRLATTHPTVAALVLSAFVDPAYARALLDEQPVARGYLLKDSILHGEVLAHAAQRVGVGECVVDPRVVDDLMAAPAVRRRLSGLTERELDVLRCMAEGLSDRGIAERLFLSPKTVATHVGHIFQRLDCPRDEVSNRRVHAVLAYLDPPAHTGSGA
jgi:DNA-binding NarL/FixJ family response regulator